MDFKAHQITAPTDLAPIQDALVEYLCSGGVEPTGLNSLREWLLSQHTDLMGVDGVICFDPSQLEHLEFTDDALRGKMYLDDDDKITDEMRLQYARGELHSAYDGELAGSPAGWCWPMIHMGQLLGQDRKCIIVGILTRFQGPGSSHVAEWCEFFSDPESLNERLKQSGYILDTAPENLDPRMLLNAWNT